jgi:hypothetical protein|tara:strand:+ start:281 stop:523 length:243 start_codon:yes stop_codon:yes gene_type:complete
LGKRRISFDSPDGEGFMSLRKRKKTEEEPAQMMEQEDNVGQQEAEYFEPASLTSERQLGILSQDGDVEIEVIDLDGQDDQ